MDKELNKNLSIIGNNLLSIIYTETLPANVRMSLEQSLDALKNVLNILKEKEKNI